MWGFVGVLVGSGLALIKDFAVEKRRLTPPAALGQKVSLRPSLDWRAKWPTSSLCSRSASRGAGTG